MVLFGYDFTAEYAVVLLKYLLYYLILVIILIYLFT